MRPALMTRALITLAACLFAGVCLAQNPIELALSSDAPQIKTVTDNLALHEVQILFTEVMRDDDKRVTFVDHEFQVDDSVYFYPASSVKFPVALLALEKLQELQGVNRYSRFQLESENEGSSFTNEIIELFVVSDNQAYNRLFEFLGKDEINRRLADKGLVARISHRLSVPESDRLQTERIKFSGNSAEPIVVGPISNQPIEVLALQNLHKGIAYMEAGERIEQPFDFSEKNYLPLSSLHGIMKRFIYPHAYATDQQFHLNQDHRAFVLKTMRTLPREAGYDEAGYPDSYVKFLMFGDQPGRMPERFDIYNKVGYAYGYLTDCAYIVDTETGREFIITATVHVNANQTFNDDEYEYEETGIPFLAELGRLLIAD